MHMIGIVKPGKQKVFKPADALLDELLHRRIPGREIVRTVRGMYPMFDKGLLNICACGDQFGVRLMEDARRAVAAEFAPDFTDESGETEESSSAPAGAPSPSGEGKGRKADRHRNKNRIVCRVDDATYEAFIRFIGEDGFDTIQGWLMHTVKRYVRRRASRGSREAV